MQGQRDGKAARGEGLDRPVIEKVAVDEVEAEFLSSAKNDLVKNFLPEQGFEDLGGGRYRRNLRQLPPRAEGDFPIQILLA